MLLSVAWLGRENFIFMAKGEINKEIKFALSSVRRSGCKKCALQQQEMLVKRRAYFFQFWIKLPPRDPVQNENLRFTFLAQSRMSRMIPKFHFNFAYLTISGTFIIYEFKHILFCLFSAQYIKEQASGGGTSIYLLNMRDGSLRLS
jgi:hypothetical protein